MTVDKLTVRPVDDDRWDDWTALVDCHPWSTVFHTRGWLRAVDSTFGYESRHAIAYDGSRPIAAIPGFAVPALFGESIVNPFCEYGFPLIREGVSGPDLLVELRDEVGPLGAWIVKDVDWSRIGGYATAEYGGVETGTSIRLRLDRPYEELWESTVDGDVRRSVRKAERSGVEVTEGDVDAFYPHYRDAMYRLGSPQFPRAFFEVLDEALGDVVTILTAQLDGDTIGAALVFERRATTIWLPATRRDRWEHRPTHALYATAIERACRDGRSAVDFGRSRPGSSVHDFKTQFGGIAHRLTSYVWPPHRAERASLSEYDRVAPLTRRAARIVTHPRIGPMLKERIHE